jgi:hypothetical protein
MEATAPHVFHGLASHRTGKVFEWYQNPEDAERAREQIVSEEPDLAGVLYVTSVDLGGASSN